MSNSINMAILLRKAWRTPEGVVRVQETASRLGFRLTTAGRVSISGKISSDRFSQLFGTSPTPVASAPPSSRDFGAPGGYTSEAEIAVPDELAEYVESISVVPPARRLI